MNVEREKKTTNKSDFFRFQWNQTVSVFMCVAYFNFPFQQKRNKEKSKWQVAFSFSVYWIARLFVHICSFFRSEDAQHNITSDLPMPIAERAIYIILSNLFQCLQMVECWIVTIFSRAMQTYNIFFVISSTHSDSAKCLLDYQKINKWK